MFMLNMKLKPAANELSLAQRLEAGEILNLTQSKEIRKSQKISLSTLAWQCHIDDSKLSVLPAKKYCTLAPLCYFYLLFFVVLQ